MLPRPSHYEMLNIQKSADNEAVKKAYRKLALVLHPNNSDRVFSTLLAMVGPEFSPYIKEAWQRLQDAYVTLADDVKRKQYDYNQSAGSFVETAEEKIRNDSFSTIWNKFKETYEIEMALAEVMKDPDYLVNLLKENKKLQVKLEQQKQQNELMSKQFEGSLSDLAKSETRIITMKQEVANEKRLREATEQGIKVLAEKLKTQTAMPSRSSFNASPYPMFNSNTPLKGLSSVRKDYSEDYQHKNKFSFHGLSLVFSDFENASRFYLSLVEKSDKNRFTIDIPRTSFRVFGKVAPVCYVSISVNLLDNYMVSFSESDKVDMLFNHLKKHFNIANVSIVEWDMMKDVLIQREATSSNVSPGIDNYRYYKK